MRRTYMWGIAVAAAMALTLPLEGQGQRASPHEKTQGKVDGATIVVEYGRPYLKGRTIGKNIVPYGKVWRTGADEATTLTTDKALTFGSVQVPAGTYTLYTLPQEDSWQLIINSQTGQWGTEYQESKDVGRVPLKKETVSQPVEQFTISVNDEQGPGGALVLQWGTLKLTAPFTVKS